MSGASALTQTGQQPSANSAPVVLASDQTPIPVITDGSTNIITNQVSVDTTSGGKLIVAARTGRVDVTIVNGSGGKTVYLGASGITTGTGLELVGIEGAAITISTAAAVYGIVGAGSQTVSFMETY